MLIRVVRMALSPSASPAVPSDEKERCGRTGFQLQRAAANDLSAVSTGRLDIEADRRSVRQCDPRRSRRRDRADVRGSVLFAVHAFGATLLRGRRAEGEEVITRSYNLIGLVVSTLEFLGTGA